MLLKGYQVSTIPVLDGTLASKRILFKKVIIIQKVQSPKLKESICNIPISEVDRNCMSLPRPADSKGLIAVKLKRKTEYRRYLLFEPVSPNFVRIFLRFLKRHNHFYSNIEIDLDNISESLTNFELATGTLYEKMINNVSEMLNIILKQDCASDVANDSKLQEADLKSPETFKNLRL